MSYKPYERNVSGIFFLGDPGSDAMMKTTSDIIISDGGGANSYIQSANYVVENGGNIGSVNDKDAISIAANGNVTFSQSVSITNDLTVGGTLFTLDTESLVVSDPLLHLGSGNPSDINDLGFFGEFDDSSVETYCGLFRDATDGKFHLFTDLTQKPTTTVNKSGNGYTVSTLVANLEGNASTATSAGQLTNSRNFFISGEGTSAPVSFNGTSNVNLSFSLDKTAITNQTNMTTIDNSDVFLVWDQSANDLKKVSRSVIVAGLGAGSMESFSFSDGTNTNSVDDGDTVFYESDGTIDWTVGNGNGSTTHIISGVVGTNSIDESHLTTSVAGLGLTGGNNSALALDFNSLTLDNTPSNSDVLAYYDGTHKKIRISNLNSFFVHDTLDGVDANEHIDHTTVTMTAGTGIAGGGTIAASRTFNLDLNSLAGVSIASSDSIAIVDSSDSNGSKKALWSNVVQTLAGDGLSALGATMNLDLGALGVSNPGSAIASGDKFAGYDGTDSVMWTTTQLGNWLAGSNISVDGAGKLSVSEFSPYSIETDDGSDFTIAGGSILTFTGGTGIKTSDDQSDTVTFDLDLSELNSTTTQLAIADGLVFSDASDSSAAKRVSFAVLSNNLAGDGLTNNAAGALEVNTGTGLETNSDTVRIAASAAGAGLTGGGGSALAVNTGAGLEVSSDAVRISTAAAGNGLTGGGGSALAVGAGSLIDVSATQVSVDLTEAAAASIAHADNLIFLDGGATGTESKCSTSSLASLFAGNGLSVNLGTSKIDLAFNDLSEVSIASGDSFAMLDSNGFTEQLSSLVDLGQYMAGTGLSDNGAGALGVNLVDGTTQTTAANARTTTASRTYAIQVNASNELVVNVPWSNSTLSTENVEDIVGDMFTTNASHTLISATYDDVGGGIDLVVDNDLSNYSNTNSAFVTTAGNGLLKVGTTLQVGDGNGITVSTNSVSVNVDDTTIGITSDQLEVKDDAITEEKLSRSIATATSNVTASNDFTAVNAATADVTITLPSNGGTPGVGRVMTVKKVDSSDNKVTIQRAGSNLIDGGTSMVLYNQNETMTFIFAGSNNWYVM